MNRLIVGILSMLTYLSTGSAQQVPVANKQPATLGRLLQLKQRANPSFQFSYDQASKTYYVPNQVILSFPAGTSKDQMKNWVDFYNGHALKNKQSVRLSLLDHKEITGRVKALMGLTSAKSVNRKVDNIAIFYSSLQNSALGVNPPKRVPGPKPPIVPTDFSMINYFNKYQTDFNKEFKTTFEGY